MLQLIVPTESLLGAIRTGVRLYRVYLMVITFVGAMHSYGAHESTGIPSLGKKKAQIVDVNKNNMKFQNS